MQVLYKYLFQNEIQKFYCYEIDKDDKNEYDN